jgi:nucleotide-binding universal stress UspA family protein
VGPVRCVALVSLKAAGDAELHLAWGRCPRETVTTAAVEGHPAEVLLAAAAHAQLLVVGSRGHSKTLGSLLASVSQYLAAHAPCPVVVIRPGADEVDDPPERPV